MHVLVVAGEYNTPTDNVAGAFIQPQLKALAERGCKVGVIYPDLRGATQVGLAELRRLAFPIWDRSVDDIREMGAEGFSVPRSITLSRKLWDLQAVRLGRAYAKRYGRPDILHAHFSFVAGPAASELSRRFSVPLVVTEHYTGFVAGTVTRFDRKRTTDTFARCAIVLAVSEPLSNAIQQFTSRAVSILPNVVHTEFFATYLDRQSETTFDLLSVGGLRSIKGFDVLLKAFRVAFPDVKDAVRLRICGEGGQRSNLERLVGVLKLQDQVSLLGACSRVRICKEVESCHAFVSSSWIETFGVSIIEAMAGGRPVVATRSGGPEYIVTSENGLLCSPGNVEELATCLRQIRSDREFWRARAPAIRDEAYRLYSAEVFAGRLREIYEDAIAGYRKSHRSGSVLEVRPSA